MTLSELQRRAHNSNLYPKKACNPTYPTLAICSEAGKLAELVNAVWKNEGHLDWALMRHDTKRQISEHVGRLLIQLGTIAANTIGLEDAATAALNKIEKRSV